MDYINSLNHIAFPLLLLLIVLIVLSILIEDSEENEELEKFYEIVSQDPNLEMQLESVKTKADFVREMVQLGSSLGYNFTIADVTKSIKSFTADTYSNHICLSIGCWTFN